MAATPTTRDLIVQSWARSAAAGLARNASARFRSVGALELERRRRAAAALLRAARPVLERIRAELGGSVVAYLTDADGIVLDSVGDLAQITVFALYPGYDWSEKAMGTNGAGTALASGRPVAVVGDEHFVRAFENCTCTAAPVRAPDGRVAGALDVSSTVADAYPGRLDYVIAMAERIERELGRGDGASGPLSAAA